MERSAVIVLDTHVLVWWANGSLDKLSIAAKNSLAKAEKIDGAIVVSAISAWEIAVLVNKGRLTLAMDVEDWLGHAAALPGVRFLPVDRHIAVQSVRLPEPFHQDPADRIIVSTARGLNLPLVTVDQEIRAYGQVRTIW
jgi:PIN domain nuclease of toxin-antitoxin system